MNLWQLIFKETVSNCCIERPGISVIGLIMREFGSRVLDLELAGIN